MKLLSPRIFLPIAFASMQLTAFPAITPEQLKQLPSPASHKIDFAKEIQPILVNSCANCHGHGRDKGDFRMDDRETFLKGGDSGPAVVPGKSAESLLIELVMGFDEESIMPAKGSRLTPNQIALLRAWIDQGAKWDEGVWLGKVEKQNLKPRSPEVPKAEKFSNPVDAIVDSYFKTNKIKWPDVVNDSVFARRVYLDVIGLLPPAGELEKFVSDKSRDKRERLVQRLLAQDEDYAVHWMTFWNDLLRNDYKGTGYIDGGRKQITKWLYNALATNMPYDSFVAELVNPTPESEGFTKGIVWRGVVNASQIPEMQAAQNISQVFMGVNMKCASCHDSFINDWQLADAYALANIYADKQLELAECDKPTGKMAKTKFLYPEFGEIDATADKPTRLKQLAASVTSEKNGRLSRTLVNRLWDRLIGYPLVPVDDMEKPAWNADLLDWLAEDFVTHNYDVRHLIAQILTSRAYQLPAVNVGENDKEYLFRGPSVRRLSAEQFRDALTTLTGVGYAVPLAEVEASGGKKRNAQFQPPVEPKWIWSEEDADKKAKAERIYFRKTFQIEKAPTQATVFVSCDNSFNFYVNGERVGSGNDFSHPEIFDIRAHLRTGENLIAIEAINHLPGNNLPTPETAVPGTENPAGLIFYARIRCEQNGAEKIMDLTSDKSWRWSREQKSNWEKTGFDSASWISAAELGGLSMQPWRLRKDFIPNKLAGDHPGTVRAALVAADSLMVALGRPNREQVVTTRPSEATTLQALEMTNGETLADILNRGAKILNEQKSESRRLVEQMYVQALGRKPTLSELQTASELLGKPVKKEGVEDFLWAMTMLPEFQLIY